MPATWTSGWASGDIVTAAEFTKGMGAIYDTTLTGVAANVDVTGIVGTYAHLRVVTYARSDLAAGNSSINLRFNNDTAANYDIQYSGASTGTPAAFETFAATSIQVGTIPANTAGANLFGAAIIDIPHYAGSANNKVTVAKSSHKQGVAVGNLQAAVFAGFWRSNAAINRITFLPGGGNFQIGTRITIYASGS